LRTQFMRSELAYANSDSASEPRLATSEASSLALEGSFASGATLTGPFDPVRGAQSLFASNLNFFDFNFLNA